MTFSAGIRRELVDRFSAREKSQEWALASFAVFSALSGSIDQNEEGWRVTIRVTGSHIASMLEDIAKSLSLPICEKKTGRRDISLTFVVSVERRALLFLGMDGRTRSRGDFFILFSRMRRDVGSDDRTLSSGLFTLFSGFDFPHEASVQLRRSESERITTSG